MRYFSKINMVFVLFVIFAAMQSVYMQKAGERCGCRFLTQLPVVEVANTLLKPVCDLAGCLLNFNCAKDCSSKLVDAAERLLQRILISAVCDHGLVCCPDQDVLRVETCLANPFVTGGSVKPSSTFARPNFLNIL